MKRVERMNGKGEENMMIQQRDQNGLTEEEFLRAYRAGDYPRLRLWV